jgi:hypothetical protein
MFYRCSTAVPVRQGSRQSMHLQSPASQPRWENVAATRYETCPGLHSHDKSDANCMWGCGWRDPAGEVERQHNPLPGGTEFRGREKEREKEKEHWVSAGGTALVHVSEEFPWPPLARLL